MVVIAPILRGSSSSAPLPRNTKDSVQHPTRSTKVRTRNGADLDLSGDEMVPSPGKRPRVTFDEHIHIHVSDWEKGPDLLRDELFRAIDRHRRGDNSHYAQIKGIFTVESTATDPPTPTSLRNHVLALTSSVSLLDKSCSDLVQAVLWTEWLGRDEGFISAYVRFLGSLVSAQGGYVTSVLSMLVSNFNNLPSSTGHLPGYTHVPRSILNLRIHTALKYLLRLIPSASGTLSPILSSTFPHSSDTQRSHTTYIQNLLRLVEYAPELMSDTIALILDRLVKIDVQVQVDIEDLEDEVGDDLVHGVARADKTRPLAPVNALENSDTDSDSSEESLDIDSQRIREVRSNVQKMDAIMDRLFAHFAPLFAISGSVQSQQAFRSLLSHFATIILPTYRSRHTQFLLFHFAQTSPLLIDDFVGACVHLAFDQGRPTILRQSSAAHMASFIARGKHVPTQIVLDAFLVLAGHLDQIRLGEEASCSGPDLRHYGTFYAMVQAMLYIFCFRWRDLLACPDDYVEEEDAASVESCELSWAPGIKEILTRTIYSKFNPLKVCSPTIVNEFARIALHLRFMYIFPLIETNKRVRLSAVRRNTLQGTGTGDPERYHARSDESYHQLDAYFPFDPYHLPISKSWLEGDYVEWRSIPGLDPAAVESDSGSEEERELENDNEDDEATETDGDGD